MCFFIFLDLVGEAGFEPAFTLSGHTAYKAVALTIELLPKKGGNSMPRNLIQTGNPTIFNRVDASKTRKASRRAYLPSKAARAHSAK